MTTLADTSILLRLPKDTDVRHETTRQAIQRLSGEVEQLVSAPQNMIEFRSVATRPIEVNGLGLTTTQVEMELDRLEKLFPLLPDRAGTYRVWRRLCRDAGVSGKQVHDTRLAAICIIHRVENILTWNPHDFARFIPFIPNLQVLTPENVLSGL